MKVLVLCMAFAAVSMAMPVAEEKLEPAAPLPVTDAKADEQRLADALPADDKKEKPALEAKEPEKVPEGEAKNAPVDVASVAADVAPEVNPEENVPKAKAAEPVEPEAEKKPEASEPIESKPEAKLENVESKAADEHKQDDVQVKEIPNDTIAKSADIPSMIPDVVNAAKTNAAVADDPVGMEVLIPTPERRIDLPVVPSKDEVAPKAIKDDVVAPAEPAKPEDIKPEVKVAEAEKPVEKISEAAAVPDTTETPNDSLRVVRDTVDDQKATKEVKPEVVAEAKLESVAPVAEPTNDIPAESNKKEEAPKADEVVSAGEPVPEEKSAVVEAEDPKEDIKAKSVVSLPAEVKPEDAKPEEVKAEEVKPEEAKPVEAKPVEAKPVEAKPEEAKAEVAKPEVGKPEEAKLDEAKAELAKPEEKPQNDAAPSPGSSEESSEEKDKESSEKNKSKGSSESSEESKEAS